jgi:hypothetical protein
VTTERIVTESRLSLVREWPAWPHYRSFSYTDHKINRALVPERVPFAFRPDLKTFCVPRPRDQFFELQPARKSRTSSPDLNSAAGATFAAAAIFRLTSSKSAFTQPTLETSMLPSSAIQKIVGTLVSP